tara:strand:- start:17459 stop:17680 length:222 start_codon:yes stop_codon:yes gene_type:complete
MSVVDTPDALEHFQFARCIAALRIEVSTGLKHSRGSMLKHVQNTYGVRSRTKKIALLELEMKYEEIYGMEYGS